ncbi:hypothetical protein ANCDUO_26898, partial [Ancylostoma duodenale]
ESVIEQHVDTNNNNDGASNGAETNDHERSCGDQDGPDATTPSLERAVLRARKPRTKKIILPPPENVPDKDLHVCAICEPREPPATANRTDFIDWYQCDNEYCRLWAHVECLVTRDCEYCSIGVFVPTGSDDEEQ